MNLFYKRSQGRNIFNQPVFTLAAKVELNPEERRILDKYKLRTGKLYTAEQPTLIRDCITIAMPVFLVVFLMILFWFIGTFGLAALAPRSFPSVMILSGGGAVVAAAVIAFLYFHFTRQSIYVTDLINGRKFNCSSVMALVAFEQDMEKAVSCFAYVMETSALWGGKQQRTIPVFDEKTMSGTRFQYS